MGELNFFMSPHNPACMPPIEYCIPGLHFVPQTARVDVEMGLKTLIAPGSEPYRSLGII